MLPRLVILDPELTYGLPASITAWTGMDALAHSLEAYYATFYHPVADGIALEGMRLVKDNLLTAVIEPRHEDARMNMLVAASMGATAFQKALGAIHALAHPIGARFHAHHGLTNAVLMPYVLAFNRPVVEAKIARAAQALGIENGFDGFFDWILRLRDQLNIPHTLEALKVTPESLEGLAEEAVLDPNTPDNPRIASKEDYLRILKAAMSGVFTGLGD
jgi:alcohol dehydrogenase class IV